MARRTLSPTSINTYLRCPRKFYLKYIEGRKEMPSIHLFRGKAVHKTFLEYWLSGPKKTDQTIKYFSRCLNKLTKESGVKDEMEKEKYESMLLTGKYSIRELIDTHSPKTN